MAVEQSFRSFAFFVFSLSHLSLSLGAARFTQQPPSPFPSVAQNTNATMEWSYAVDNKNKFDDHSPVWEYKEDGGGWVKIAFEDGLEGWKWKIDSGCPAKFLSPVTRVGKGKANASLVIYNTRLNDIGSYRCKLVMGVGLPIISEVVRLVVTAPTTRPPSTTIASTTVNGSTTISSPASSTPTPTPTPTLSTTTKSSPDKVCLRTGEIAGIIIGVLAAVGFISVVVVVIYKKVKKDDTRFSIAASVGIIIGVVVASGIIVAIVVAIYDGCMKAGLLVGITFGVLVVVGIIAAIAVIIYKKKKNEQTNQQTSKPQIA